MPYRWIRTYTHRAARTGPILLATALVMGLYGAPAPAEATPPTDKPTSVLVPGATIVEQQAVTARTVELTVDTPSFTSPAKVEVTLPIGYSEQPDRRWPVTYFLSGLNGNQTAFRIGNNGEALTTNYESIVVSPNGNIGNNAGIWSDWYNYGAGGPPRYETFVIDQLIPLIDANFRTTADRAHRVMTGTSMGGYGALMMAARHPDQFTAVAAFSGVPDSNWIVTESTFSAFPLFNLSVPDAVYGPRLTEEVRWRGHNPVDLAENLRGLDVQMFSGNGVPGLQELNEPLVTPGCAVEAGAVRPENESLHRSLLELGIAHTYTVYNWGCHTSALVQQQLKEALPRLSQRLQNSVSAPSTVNFRSINPQFEAYDWTVTADASRALEFLDLQNANRTGFTLTGTGVTQVLTPPLFTPNRRISVTIEGVSTILQADSSGKLRLNVNLGPASLDQQYRLGSTNNLRTVDVLFGEAG